ncbi:IclR family transcriptional regulator [Clostridium sp. DL1XJH146]
MKKSRAATRTIDILELISNETKGLSLTEIASTLDIPITSVSDIVRALLDKEMIEVIDERSKLYGIGVKAYYIGNAFISNTTLVDKARDTIEALGTRMNKTVFLGKEVNKKITYIYKFEPKDSIITTCPIGSRTNLHCTSLGKCFLASNDELMSKLDSKDLIKKTDYTIVEMDELKKEVEKVRKQGYGVDCREQSDHLLCIGAPVFNDKNEIIAAVSISGLYRDDVNIEKEAEIVKESALIISRKMGYKGL